MSVHVAPDNMSVGPSTEKQREKTTVPEHFGHMQPISCEYVGADEVLVMMTNERGEAFSYSLTTKMLVQGINQQVAVINNFRGQILRDIGAL
jgi:hypothetical protein